tara:strand:+ start:686 stop:1690 length:1005 start_codon:yes stop_codon:yes gene_type:complete
MAGPLMVSIEGTTLDAVTRSRLAHPNIGGVILFARNYTSPEQLLALTREIKSLKSPVLMVAVDQEGGPVQRFREGFTPIPTMETIGKLFDNNEETGLAVARASGNVLSGELRQCGVDFSFAPVMDIFSSNKAIGARAFHQNPTIVTTLAHALAAGMASNGMRAVGKHFPGHSGVIEDPHHELPRDDRSIDELRDHDMQVYRNLNSGTITGVMSCHVWFPEIDNRPASLSHKFLTGELRGRLAFNGPIFSDDLMMSALSTIAAPEGLARMALEAGSDMALLCNSDEATDQVLEAAHLPPQSDASRGRLEMMRPDAAYTADDVLLNQAREQVARHI